MVMLAVGFAALQFIDDTTEGLAAPEHTLAAVANYGGAQIYDRNGELLYRYTGRDGAVQMPAQLEDVSPHLILATVSTEDNSFWEGRGVDFQGTASAAWDNVRANGNPFAGRGGSGITQQLVKLTLIEPEERYEQSLSRKANEAVYAMEIARLYSKEQILEWYLNVINYGGVFVGIESAAQGYFGVPASDLTLAQASMLAGIPQSPAQYSPYVDPEGAKQRQAEVLDIMVRHGHITEAEAEEAKEEPLRIRTREEALPMRAPWFVEHVRQQLVTRYGEACFETCGLEVTTSLDIDLQERAQEILDENIEQHSEPIGAENGALVSIDGRTGEVLAMVGSRDYEDESPKIQGSNNYATAAMEPGSAFKPFVYLTMFKEYGYGPQSIIWDAPFETDEGYECENPVGGGRVHGPIPVRIALGSSLNCPANRAAEMVGGQAIIDMARAMGISTLGNDASLYGASIATGGANVNLLDLSYAYATLGRNGSMVGMPGVDPEWRALDPVSLLDVRDATGRVLYSFEPETRQAVEPGYAYLVNSITSDCEARRLIWPCTFPTFQLEDGRPVALKTGTQQGADTKHTIGNWEVMYTPNLVTGGWVGNADRTPWTNVSGGANAVGWSVKQLAEHVIDEYDIPAADFERPDDVVEVPVRVPDGSLRTGGCGPMRQGLFVRGTEPDSNNRVCRDGRLTIPAEQVGTGGLPANYRLRQPCVPDAERERSGDDDRARDRDNCPTATATPTSTPTPTIGGRAGRLMTPASGASVSGSIAVVGHFGGDGDVAMQWGAGPSPGSWSALGVAASGSNVFASWDTSALSPGIYTVRMLVDGSVVSVVTVQVGSDGSATPAPSSEQQQAEQDDDDDDDAP
ncbi:MAG: transglycosylase domain-containing protein [Dehalococcoidia bacterium]